MAILSLKEIGKHTKAVIDERRAPGYKAPPPDVYDDDKFPFGAAPGDNKFEFEICPSCDKPPSVTPHPNMNPAFLFRDMTSAREYQLSGLCQQCQDRTFQRG